MLNNVMCKESLVKLKNKTFLSLAYDVYDDFFPLSNRIFKVERESGSSGFCKNLKCVKVRSFLAIL